MLSVSVSTAAPSPVRLSRALATGGGIIGLLGLTLLIGPGCRNSASSPVMGGDPFAASLQIQATASDRRALEEARLHLAASTAENERKDRELGQLLARCERLQRLVDTAQAEISDGAASAARLPRHLREHLSDITRVYGDWVRFDPAAGTLILQSDFTFVAGQSTLTPDATAALRELAGALTQSSPRPIEVVVAAHTDRKPISLDEAARRRDRFSSAEHAMSVVDTLVAGGVAVETLAIAAWGDARPVAGNDDPSGRAANRRIELRLTLRAPAPSTTASLDWNELLSE